MADFPALLSLPNHCAISTSGLACPSGDVQAVTFSNFNTAGAWPAANRAIYIPFLVETTVTAYQMSFNVNTQSGNCDVGIYDYLGNRVVSKGSTAVGAAGIQVVDIADTVLTPGAYFMAMCVDTTAAFFARHATNILYQEVCGVQQQAVGAVTLPNPATFANPASVYVPALSVNLNATV